MAQSGTGGWICSVCGYVHQGAEPPEECPICGVDRTQFEPHVEEPAAAQEVRAGQWRCLDCNYVHDGDSPPDECPVCGSPADRFEPLTEEGAAEKETTFTGHLVVIGGGIAGISALEAFRRATSSGTVTLITDESELPYYRLNLTRFLAGEIGEEDLPIHDRAWYAENSIELKLGTEVLGILPDELKVRTGEGELACDKLILSAGAHPFVPPFPGVGLEGVTSLRTVNDARRIREAGRRGKRCVVIGGGILGLEAAGALAMQKADVTLLEGHEWLMPRQLNRKAGDRLERHAEGLGVKIRKCARTRKISGTDRVSEVCLESGENLPADTVIIATGIRPNTWLARRAGLEVGKGVVVDNYLTSSNKFVLAAGDIAEHRGVLYGDWFASQAQGSIAGANAAGTKTEFGGIPRSNKLKVLGMDMLSIGKFEAPDGSFRVVESETDEAYMRFVFRDSCMVGSVLVGDAGAGAAAKKAIESKKDFSSVFLKGTSAEHVVEALKKM
jgi:nitrite reductase (NADH) large subunit